MLLSPARAAEPDSAACQAARTLLAKLSEQQQQLAGQQQALDALLDGTLPTRLDTLNEQLGQPLDAPLPLTRPAPARRPTPDSKCPSLQDDISVLSDQINSLRAANEQLRRQVLTLPLPQRRAFATLLQLREQLRQVTGSPPPPAAQPLLQHIDSVLATLAPLARQQYSTVLEQLDRLWYLPPTVEQSTDIDHDTYLQLMGLRLQMQAQIRKLRADLWQRRSLWQMVASLGGFQQVPGILAHEAERIARQGLDIFTLTRSDLSHEGHHPRTVPVIKNLVAVILGIAAFVLLVRLAGRSRRAALNLHDRVIRASGDRRWLWNISRLISGLAPALPWILIWLVLDALSPWLDQPATRLLFWLLPVAKAYVIFGLMCLGGEWLLLRVAQGAGRYLNSEQSGQATGQARRFALTLLPLWLAMMMIQASLGPSLLYYLVGMVLLTALYLALGRLLVQRRDDYCICLQALLPSRLDPAVEVLLHPAVFWLFAPLLLPVALVSFAVTFTDRVLGEFDWYVRLKARWFRLRTRVAEGSSEDDGTEAPKSEHYERWFAATVPEGSKMPVIDTGLASAMEKSIQRWHEDKTDENALIVAGEKGCGKSLSLQRLEKALAQSCPDLNIVPLSVPAKTCTPEAIYTLVGEALDTDLSQGPGALVESDEGRAPTLLVLDEGQNFFLASIGGLDGWRAVQGLLNARLNNIFLLLMINNQSWAYLNNVFGHDSPSRNVIRVKRWGQTDLRALILSRHQLSGYTLRYDEALLSSRGPEAGNVRNAEQRYFSLLWDASRGNPMVALRLWLTSSKLRGKQVLVGLPTPPSASVLDGMGDTALFVYAAIATHENLTTAEISAVTHLAEPVVRYALKAGFDTGFLQKSEDGRYRLVPLWYQQVISYLTGKNLLNE
ncbi:hypothetical protein A11A3_12233 [Alcanivorax hongdengensis A-11-3]|uniref:ORC1/DEAH AAA+ ATPase domain-containing protein n=2 Tax=Alcanivorax hongdengensis TaxID=519051 RepID=L0W9U2_9GAMM|nr:hypothetical protein A11A3_12233 [Alcanivorax hongdengensis A-11-3]